MNQQELLTVREVAEMLKVTEQTVRHLVRDGKLDRVPIGAGKKRPRYRIAARQVRELIDPDPTMPYTPDELLRD